jgi:tetratricopeptide (TPR) repeat protein
MSEKASKTLSRPVIQIILIFALGLFVYSNTFHAPFVFDDENSIEENIIIKNLGHFDIDSIGYKKYPTRFIGYLTFAINYEFGGLDVTGYHIFNLFVHLANALLVYFLILLTFRTPLMKDSSLSPYSRPLAFFTSVFFLVHPIQTEAVTYIVQRLASLATMFYLLAVCLYARARLFIDSGEPQYRKAVPLYLLSIVSSVFAMKTKEIAFTLPIVIAMYEFFFCEAKARQRLLYLLPFLFLLPIIPLTLLNIDKPWGEILSDVSDVTRVKTTVSRWDYLITQFSVITTYIRLMFLPVGQNIDYDYPISHSIFTPRVFMSFFFLLGVLAAGVVLFFRSRKDSHRSLRLLSFGILWFFITISVESSFIPIIDPIFEHRMYLPSVGVILAVIVAAAIFARRFLGGPFEKVLIPIAVVIVLALSVSTYRRNTVWSSPVSLWEDSTRKSPGKDRPHYNLGVALLAAGRNAEAERSLLKAIEINPDDAKSHNNLALAFSKQGRHAEAIDVYIKSIVIEPEHAKSYNNLGIALIKTGRQEEAIAMFQKSIDIQPAFAEPYFNLGRLYLDMGNYGEAASMLRKTIARKPDHFAARITLAATYNQTGEYGNAVAVLQANIPMLKEHPAAHYNLGVAYYGLGNLNNAKRELELLWRLDPRLASDLEAVLKGTAK